MKKQYKVSVPVDYIQGYLRYGHKEKIIESDKELSKEEIIEIAKASDYYDWDIIVDDYSIEDSGDMGFDELYYMEVEVDE